MSIPRTLLCLRALVFGCALTVATSAQVSVLMQHNDIGRTGQNLAETVLNTTNVNVNSFGKLFWRTVDGDIVAQPLYYPNLNIRGTVHNVVFVATEHNSVYAFDADDPNAFTALWQVNFGTPVPSADICIVNPDPNNCPYLDLQPEIGITSTPVIDATSNTMYIVAKTKNTTDSTYHFWLHALDITSGAETFGGPTEIAGQVNGTGAGSGGGVVSFDPVHQLNRPGLLLMNGAVYIAFGSIGDIGVWHGWVFGYSASTLAQTAILNITPNGASGGVWSSDQGIPGDNNGDIYMVTSNGTFDANTGGLEYGDSYLKLSTASGLAVADFFTPDNQSFLDSSNLDLGSGGPMMLPGTTMMVGIGKDDILRLINTGNMGKYNSSKNNDVQEFTVTTAQPYLGSPVYWDSPSNGPTVYVWGAGDVLKAYQFSNGLFQTNPVSQSIVQSPDGYSNAVPMSISANGSQVGTGILWGYSSFSGDANPGPVPGVLRAFDATNLSQELWDSKQNVTRDDVGYYAKFNPPTVATGKVYLGTFSGQLLVYGLNPPPTSGIGFVQVASATPQSSTSTVSVSFPSPQTAGDLNVVVVGWDDTTQTVQTVRDSAGNTYGLAIGPTTGTGLRQSIYYAKNISGGSNTVTVTFNQAASNPDIRILEYSGIDTVNPLDVSAGTSGNSDTPDSGFVATTAANELVVGANTVSSSNLVPGSPLTLRILTKPNSNIAEDRVVNVMGSYHTWAFLSQAANWVMQTATFKALGSSNVPTVTSVLPNVGPTAGGTAVTITGANFASGATVTFGGAAASNVVVVSSTTITATTPAGNAGAVTVTVTVNGQSGSLPNGFTYTSSPIVNSVSPNSGPTAGGTAVTITGANFASGATVTFGGAAASNVVVVSSTTITATTPAGNAGAVTVTVTVNGQSGSLTNGFTYNAPVTIGFAQVAAATPQSPKQVVTVKYPGAQTAGDLNVVVVGWNDTSTTVQSVKDSVGNTYSLAIGPTSGTALRQSIYYAANIVGGSNTVTVTFSKSASYPDIRILEYRGVSALDVTAGAIGTSATASSGSATTSNVNELIFGANTVATGNSSPGTGFTARIITSPDADIAEDEVVSTAGSFSATAPLTAPGAWVMQMVTFSAASGPAPTVTSVSPNSGPTAGGTAVTITGANFASGATVTFGGAAASNVVVVSSTTITATTPAGNAGAVTVTVTVNGQSGSLPNGFTYTSSTIVNSVSPNSGPTAGETAVTITGANFASGATVTFGGAAASNVVVVSSTTITATTPAGNAGAVTVTVTVNGQS